VTVTLESLRAYSLSRSLWRERSLERSITRLGFVQADPIRAPARAQDLILRPRVPNYRAGDLEAKYAKLPVEEDFFVNYGFVPRAVQPLMHPRRYENALRIETEAPGLSERVLEFVRTNGATHPKQLEKHFGKLKSGNYWGGTSQATTRVLDGLHYRGQLRVARRDNGIKVYDIASHLSSVFEQPLSDLEMARGLIHLIVNLYAPLPMPSLGYLVSLSGYGAPHLKKTIRPVLKRVVAEELNTVKVAGVVYAYPLEEHVEGVTDERVRLLAPFDPVVWDRRRFELLHGWAYRFEAYTPASKRTMGYYALPLFWGDRAIGWANLKVVGEVLEADLGFNGVKPKGKAFKLALEAELEAMRAFLGLA
jgi:uncharacterized protein